MQVHEPDQGHSRPCIAIRNAIKEPDGLVNRWFGFFCLIALLIGPPAASGLDGGFGPGDLRDDEMQPMEEIAAYPSLTRHLALVVAGYPEELLETQKIQEKSAKDFANLLASYPRETQEKIWDLVRYPGLAKAIARGGRKTTAQLEKIAARFPRADREAILAEGRERYSVWVQIYALDLEVQQTFSGLVSDLPVDVRDAFDELTDHPGLVTLLVDNVHMTTVLGAEYLDDPSGVEKRLEEQHDDVAARKVDEERAWSKEVSDPKAAERLENAVREFADEYDYDVDDVLSTPATTATIRATHYVDVDPYPYPYWFGYPIWYDVAYWYPLSIWNHVGFRSGGGYGYTSVGLPSPFFLGWYHRSYFPRHHISHDDYDRHSSYGRDHYYDNHRPHISARARRHHDSSGYRTHLSTHQRDDDRSHGLGVDGQRHRGSRSHQIERNPRRRHDSGIRHASSERRHASRSSADIRRTARHSTERNPSARMRYPDRHRSNDRHVGREDRSSHRERTDHLDRREDRQSQRSGEQARNRSQNSHRKEKEIRRDHSGHRNGRSDQVATQPKRNRERHSAPGKPHHTRSASRNVGGSTHGGPGRKSHQAGHARGNRGGGHGRGNRSHH